MMSKAKCPISGQQCVILPTERDGTQYDSNCGGGVFFVTGSALSEITDTDTTYPRLARWVYEQNLYGVKVPELTTLNWQGLAARSELKTTDKVRELLRFVRGFDGNFNAGYMGEIDLAAPEAKVFAACDLPFNFDAYLNIRRHAIEAGYLNEDDNSLTFQAHQYLEALDSIQSSSSQAFVAMWFDPALSHSLFSTAIEPAVYRAGYKAFRVDQKDHANRIDDEIVGEIRRSRFIIADFTCPIHQVEGVEVSEHRGGVYYEAGLAHGLGLPVIWTCRADLVKSIHFDTRQFNHLLWEQNKLDDFSDALEKRIRAVLGQGPVA